MNKNDKLKRVEKLIRFLIFSEKLGYESVQKDLTDKLGTDKSVISRALNGDMKYLTDNFIDKLNSSFGNEFNLEWLLKGNGIMLKKPSNENDFSLYHYTSSDGLIGILESGIIKFSSFLNANDVKERYIYKYFKETSESGLSTRTDEEAKKIFNSSFKYISFCKYKSSDSIKYIDGESFPLENNRVMLSRMWGHYGTKKIK